MFHRSRIVWRLSAVFVTLILCVFAILGHVNNLIDKHYALAYAREQSQANAAAVLQLIHDDLMIRDNEAIRSSFDELATNRSEYGQMRLISHDGRIAVSRLGDADQPLKLESEMCQRCHEYDPLRKDEKPVAFNMVVTQPDGSRTISVISPIANKPSCSAAACHAHADGRPTLGFLQTDFSLSRVDALSEVRSLQTVFAAATAIFLGAVGMWFVVGRIVERPLRELNAGMEHISQGELDYRLPVRRKDEFATLAETFNSMVTKLELLLQRFRETRSHLEGIVESSGDIIITVNPNGVIQSFNAGAELVLGYQRDEVCGQSVDILFADPAERSIVRNQVRAEGQIINHATVFRTKNGETRDVIFSVSRLFGPYDIPMGTFAIGKDVTNVNKLQQQLIQSEKYAAIGQSFTAIQHSMKNMMNALTGGSYMVKVGIEKENWEMLGEGWAMVTEGISNIRDLSKNLLMYVKDWEPEIEPVSIGKIVDKIRNVFAKTAADNGATFTTSAPPDLPMVRCDASLIHSAIMDIVSNALEACLSKEYSGGEAPRIDLSVTHSPALGKMAIDIRDNGPGMDENVRAHIFTPFFSTKKKKGTGLGLALTARIVSLHGGTIDVTSEPGIGSVFRILLPVAMPGERKENRDGEESAGH